MSLSILPSWLPPASPDLSPIFRSIADETNPSARLTKIEELAQFALDFVKSGKLDRQITRTLAELGSDRDSAPPLRIAWLGFSTVEHLVPCARVAAVRRGMLLDVYVAPYGQARQELLDPDSSTAKFAPQIVLVCLDHEYALESPRLLASEAEAAAIVDRVMRDFEALFVRVTQGMRSAMILQTIPNLAPAIFGSLDANVPGSRRSLIARLNDQLRQSAASHGVHLLDLATLAERLGYDTWFDSVRWLHAKQLVSPVMAPLFGEYLARIVAAIRGRSRKCLILDLDNTLWGGVIGDDGAERLVVGHGSAAGESFLALQFYAKQLRERGILLAVCSKNDESVARAGFQAVPEMALALDDFSIFVANWHDKASNIRYIAKTLNLGLDAMVFVDDNPAERALVRAELPTVAVPELPEDPAHFVRVLQDAGYFEAIAFTADDQQRAALYADEGQRAQALESATDMDSFLAGLTMKLEVSPVNSGSLLRVTQLINKTNQFNLTTRRYTEPEVSAFLEDSANVALQFRLIDRFGDSGCIGVMLAKADRAKVGALRIDTFLMSCRVLGRGVEHAMLNALVLRLRRLGATELAGEYVPTAKNGMVSGLYARLGFEPVAGAGEGEVLQWRLDLLSYREPPTFIELLES
jgi:FkbH-like protein